MNPFYLYAYCNKVTAILGSFFKPCSPLVQAVDAATFASTSRDVLNQNPSIAAIATS